jgi:hypothetical protein
MSLDRPAGAPAAPDELEPLISLLRATLEETADGLLVVDREGRISRRSVSPARRASS